MTLHRRLHHRLVATVAAAGLMAVPVAATAGAASAAPATTTTPTSLASVLLADTVDGKPSFDGNRGDFDIVTGLVLKVLAAKPGSSVGVLADGTVKLTAFIPNDRAFVKTAGVLGLSATGERATMRALISALGIDTVESVLLYHVVPGAKITSQMAAASDGAALTTALGKKIVVNVKADGIFLRDLNREVANPKVIATDINRSPSNPQIAHVINGVLLPI